MPWIHALAGLFVGFTVGLTGLGGGSLMTPILVLACGIAPAVAVGTDLVYASITAMGGTWAHGRRGRIDWKIVGRLSSGSVPAVVLSLFILMRWGMDSAFVSSVVRWMLAIGLMGTAATLALKERLLRAGFGNGPWRERGTLPATMVIGALLGIVVSISSVGAGAMGMLALLFLYPEKTTAEHVGTNIAHAVPLTAIAGLGHSCMGTVNVTLLGSLLVGSLPGIYVGSRLCARVPESVMRPLMAAVLFLVGGRLIL